MANDLGISYDMVVRIHTETLKKALTRILGEEQEIVVSDDVKYEDAKLYRDKVAHYVPKDTGTLRDSAYMENAIVRYKGTYAIRYYAARAKTKGAKVREYAEAQYYGDDATWNRKTEGTYSHWNQHLQPFEREEYYRELAKEMKDKIEEKLHGSTR